jgi:hypothetical protein
MDLIRQHNPVNRDHLVALIASHQLGEKDESCKCGCRSAGTIEDFGANLYKANLDFFKDKPEQAKTLQECTTFMYNLFVVQSLKGNLMEDKALSILKAQKYNVRNATDIEDFQMGVDIVIIEDNKDICGIQVKPVSYGRLPHHSDVVQVNLKKNKKFGKEVIYMYYDLDNNFVNTDEVILKLKKHITL